MFGLILSLITTLFLLIVKNFWYSPIILGITLAITILFYMKVRKTFLRPMEMTSIHAAADLDRADTVRLVVPR
jgi:uncharacterized membrane protein YgaE (UPF0421/DUF939 family)